MNALPSTVQTALGRTLHLTKQIGKGGEGAIYETREQNDIAVKLYWPTKAQSRRDKIVAMASAQFYKTNSFVAFPVDVLFEPNGGFAGFAMKKIGASKPVHMLYSPASRKVEFSRASYKFLVRAAGNIARAVASAHRCGCVIGDVNHSGFLVSDKAISVLIDSDLFQVVAGNKNIPLPSRYPRVYAARVAGRTLRSGGSNSQSRQFWPRGFDISAPVYGQASVFRTVSGLRGHALGARDRGTPLRVLGGRVGNEHAAASGRSCANRLRARNWAGVRERVWSRRAHQEAQCDRLDFPLGSLEKTVVDCTSDLSHQHVKGKPCPWCRMEQSSPGFIAFTPIGVATDIPIHVDVAQLVATLNTIRDPGPTPDIHAAMVVPRRLGAPAEPSTALISTLRTRAYIGIGASAAGAILIFFGGVATLPGLAVVGDWFGGEHRRSEGTEAAQRRAISGERIMAWC